MYVKDFVCEANIILSGKQYVTGITFTGIVRATVCQPAVVLTAVEGVTPKSKDGLPPASEYTPRITLPDPAL